MSEQFRGKVEIQNSNGSGTAIVLDGNAKPQKGRFIVTDPDDHLLKSVVEGEHFITGQIDVKDAEGNIRLSLLPLASTDTSKGGGWIKVHRGGIILMAHKRTKPGESDTTIQLDASSGAIRIEGAAGETLAVPGMLRMADGRLRLGSEASGDGNNDGSLRLRDAAGETIVLLDASNAALRINNAKGETLTIPGMLRMVDGRLRLGSEPSGGGADGSLRLRNAKGQERIHLDGRSGDVVLHNAQGQETMRLDGSGGDIILQHADCAEEFDIVNDEAVEPGTVMVLDDKGKLCSSSDAYDKRVAGVVSGAGDYKPGLLLDKQPDATNRLPIALMGKVFCKVDARHAPIAVGDLLTTSPTPGRAMKAADVRQAFGAVLGKALKPLAEGVGTIPILVSLQ